MKNLLLFLALAFAAPVFSQDQKEVSTNQVPKEKFSLGLLGGMTMSNMPFSPVPRTFEGLKQNTRSEFVYFAGLGARQPIGKRFAALLESHFSVKGFGLDTRFRFNYLDFVPQLEYKVFKNFHFSLGGYWGVRLEERIKYEDGDWQTIDSDFFEYADDHDFGAVAGLSCRMKRFSAILRYQHGIGSVSDGIKIVNENGEVIDANQHNRTLQIGIGFKIL